MGLRIGSLIIAVAVLYAAMRIHKAQGKWSKQAKYVGVVMAFLAGLALLGTFVGGWMGSVAGWAGVVGIAALVIAAVVLVMDIAVDGKPDKAAFWCAVLLPILLVFGISQWPNLTGQVGDGWDRVSRQVSSTGS